MTDKPGYRRPQEGTQPAYLHPTYQSTNLRSPSKPLVFLPHSSPGQGWRDRYPNPGTGRAR